MKIDFEDLARQLRAGNYRLYGEPLSMEQFIDEMNKQAPIPGISFYSALVKAVVTVIEGDLITDRDKIPDKITPDMEKIPPYGNILKSRVFLHCKQKIEELSRAKKEETATGSPQKRKLRGFQSNLTCRQIESLYDHLHKEKYFDTDKANFKAMLTGEECYPISWLHRNNRGEVNHYSLGAFIETILKQTKKIAKTHFNEEIKSGLKRKEDYYKRYITKYQNLIN